MIKLDWLCVVFWLFITAAGVGWVYCAYELIKGVMRHV